MIKTEAAYKKALEKLQKDKAFIQNQKRTLEEIGLTGEQVDKALQPSITFHEQLREEVLYYERIGVFAHPPKKGNKEYFIEN